MSDPDVAELLKLPAEAKLRLLELLWESLSTGASALSLSNVHRAAIDEVLDEHRQAPDDGGCIWLNTTVLDILAG
jgi:hypothetical protein